MLDIQIFRVDEEIKKDGKVVGSVPKVSLGTYTPIPVQTQTHISKAMKEFGQENAHSVEKNLVAIGIVDTFANYTKILEGKIHPYVRQVVSRQLSMLESHYPQLVPNRADGRPAESVDFVEQRAIMLKHLQDRASPIQLIGVMVNAVSQYHNCMEMEAEKRSFLGRGIAWGVEMLKRTPNLSAELKYLAIDGKHRPVLPDMYQRS